MAVVSFRRIAFSCLLLWVVVFPTAGSAHRLPPEVITFVRLDASRLHVLVRVPTAMLGDARLPVIDTAYLDLGTIDERLRVIATEVTRSLDITDDGRPLTPGSTAWILSPLGDGSFASYETAVSRFTQPPIPQERFVYWNEAFADFQFEYPVTGATPRISARLNGLRLGGDFFQTRATYLPPSGRPRTLTVAGPPQRVVFEPPLSDALGAFLRRGAERLLTERLLLIFLVCLAIPRRSAGAVLRPFALFAAAHVLAVTVVAARAGAVAGSTMDLAQVVAGCALALAAVQNIMGAGLAPVSVAAALFGAASGVGLGGAMRQLLPLAGSHAAPALVLFLVVIEIGAAWVLLMLQPVARIPFGWRVPAWLTLAALSAIPAHEGAHAAIDAAGRLEAQDLAFSGPVVHVLVTHWPVLALTSALVVLLFVSLTGRRAAPWMPPEGRTSS